MNHKSFFTLVFILLTSQLLAVSNDKVVGVWLTQEKRSEIEITKNNDGSFAGTIIWLKEPMENGKPKMDKNNPEENLKHRKLIGLHILKDFKYNESDEEWDNGTIYDPETGNTYKCYMWFDDDEDTLNVKGYIGFSLIGRRVEWTRVE